MTVRRRLAGLVIGGLLVAGGFAAGRANRDVPATEPLATPTFRAGVYDPLPQLDILQTIPFGVEVDRPAFVVAGNHAVWIGRPSAKKVTRLFRDDHRPPISGNTPGMFRESFDVQDVHLGVRDVAVTAPGVIWLVSSVQTFGAPANGPTGAIERRAVGGRSSGDVIELEWPASPSAVELAFGTAWVLDTDRGLVLRMDPDRARVEASIRVGIGSVWTFAATNDALWAADNATGSIVRIDPRTNAVRRIGEVPHVGSLIGVGETLWATTSYPRSIARIDPDDGSVIQRLDVESVFRRPVTDGRTIWFTGGTAARTWLYALDPRTGNARRMPTTFGPELQRAAYGALWFIDDDMGTVLRARKPTEMSPYGNGNSPVDEPEPRRLADGTKPPAPPALLRSAVRDPVVLARTVDENDRAITKCYADRSEAPTSAVMGFVSPDGLSVVEKGKPEEPTHDYFASSSCDAVFRDGEWNACGEFRDMYIERSDSRSGWDADRCYGPSGDRPPVVFCSFVVPRRVRWVLQWRFSYWTAFDVRGTKTVRMGVPTSDDSYYDTFLLHLDDRGRRLGTWNADCHD